ncbi:MULTISPECIES: respiratory chain complex I subunit 1 family protein [Acidianus]|uniref:Formate hydrogenlyase n=1 Tax=Candidatus Acidianus copahuensis TaxID=1160895 RepID=A0A031LSG2_9CREN|nr:MULTISPECIES: respiratory chain complex I subunit 1 family protein [Acidianus]EZQ10685.1 formate hydrogenlyase [Candidatus Acidianus copahuensis]NON62671.1 respiratory chain complex I subunit 1 family protein [Acidianus sp. RZ1]
MISQIVEAIVQVLGSFLLAPLYVGILDKLKGMVSSRKAQSVFQPYYDIFKLLRKETILPNSSGLIFLYTPYFVLATYILISFVIPVVYPEPVFFTPVVDFLGGALLFSLAAFLKTIEAMESKSNLVALGVSRVMSFNFLGEATLITVFFAVALSTGTNNPYVESHFVLNPSNYLALDHVLASVSFFMLWLFETGKLPVESSGLNELGMIDDSLTYEYSGKPLAILKWGSYLKAYLLGSVLLNVFFLPWGLFTGVLGSIIDVGVMFLKWLLLISIVLILETSLAKFRLFKVQDFLAVALVLSVISLFFSVVGYV